MKNLISYILIITILCTCFCTAYAENNSHSLSVVVTIYPEYDWVLQILGANPAQMDVTLLLDSATDLHSFQPTVNDMIRISECDLFIYVGGESDEWVEDALAEAINPDMKVLNLMDLLADSVKEEEIVEGMQSEKEQEEEEEGPEYDEHVWLSLRNAQILTAAICETLSEIDPENANVYVQNTAAYNEKLSALDTQFTEMADTAARKVVLFGDRFPFRYLVDDYGIDYYAAFVGCSAETEASFQTITFLAGKIDELQLPVVLTIEGNNHSIAETIVRNTKSADQQILTMNSLQSADYIDSDTGSDYLSIMERNFEVLKTALN